MAGMSLPRFITSSPITHIFPALAAGCTFAEKLSFIPVFLQPFVLRDPQTKAHYAAIGASSDGGESWQLGNVIGPDCDEGKVVELTDGSILLHARATPRRRLQWWR